MISSKVDEHDKKDPDQWYRYISGFELHNRNG